MSTYQVGTKRYFASANGFGGFRSNFAKVFTPKDVERLFVIKGGPGTGKSTLMREIANHHKDDSDITYIHCSSDPRSLDAIILNKNGCKIAVADGTSPHAIEPKYPGVFETLIDLGKGFKLSELAEMKNDIITFTNEKSSAYENAYHHLDLAGQTAYKIHNILVKTGIYHKAELLVKQMINADQNAKNQYSSSPLLLSAFCKDGLVRFSKETDNKRMIKISGDGISEYLIMESLRSYAATSIGGVSYCCALCENMTDFIELSDYIICVGTVENSFDSSALVKDMDDYNSLKDVYDQNLNEARMYLKKASEYHFKLEKIYSARIDFTANDKTLQYMLDKIDKITK